MSLEWLHRMDAEGQTPIDRAFNSGHMGIAEIMLRQEKRDSVYGAGEPPLHRAALLGLVDATRTLLRFGARHNERDTQDETVLHKAIRSQSVALVSLLLPYCDVNAQSSECMTPLQWACVSGNEDLAAMLLAHGADPTIRNESLDGLNAMEIARAMGYGNLCAYLEHGEVYV